MNEEEIEVYTDSSGYLESLVNAWTRIPEGHYLEKKFEEVILAELSLALLAAEKAKSEIIKRTKNNIKEIK